MKMNRPFTGLHMLGAMVAFMGVVIAVNVFMARQAISTFGGVVVDNSYVASQNFNKWLDEANAEKALGWTAKVSRTPDGRVHVALAGVPADAEVSAVARHPLGHFPDVALKFVPGASGYVSEVPLAPERWRLRVTVKSAGKTWRNEQDVM